MAHRHLPRRWWVLAVSLLVVATVLLAHPLWMRALGWYLVKAEQPAQADIAVALAGDGFGNRVLKAAELVRRGYTTRILVSGPDGMYDGNEADLAVAYAVRRGSPPSWFLPFPIKAYSTREEARAIVPELRRLGVRRVLLVTSDYHSRRAGAVYRKLAPEMQFRVVSAPDRFFRADDWWRTREGQKRFVLEWMKTIATWLGV